MAIRKAAPIELQHVPMMKGKLFQIASKNPPIKAVSASARTWIERFVPSACPWIFLLTCSETRIAGKANPIARASPIGARVKKRDHLGDDKAKKMRLMPRHSVPMINVWVGWKIASKLFKNDRRKNKEKR